MALAEAPQKGDTLWKLYEKYDYPTDSRTLHVERGTVTSWRKSCGYVTWHVSGKQCAYLGDGIYTTEREASEEKQKRDTCQLRKRILQVEGECKYLRDTIQFKQDELGAKRARLDTLLAELHAMESAT